MTESLNFSMLNLDPKSRIELDFLINNNQYIDYHMEIGPQIEVERRRVTSLASLFGELGGLNDFFGSFIVLIISSYQANSFLVDSIKRLFLMNENNR